MMKPGHRMIDGREYMLNGRFGSKEAAQDVAKSLRARGYLVRIVKLCAYDFKLYQH